MAGRLVIFLKIAAIVLIAAIAIYSVRVYASSLDYIWGSLPPDFRVAGEIPLDESSNLYPGEWFAVTYEIKIKKWPWEGEDVVVQRVREHLQQILGRIQYEHPEVWLRYAEYRYVRKECNIFGYCEYVYRAKIIGKVMTQEELAAKIGSNTSRIQLVAWVPVAIIIALIVAAITAAIILVQQPAVQKLILATSEAVRHAVETPWIMALLILLPILIIIILIQSSRRVR